MTSVNTNVGALNAQANMLKNQKAMEDAMARLSSGLRLNTAADDAAGVSISERMEAQIRGLSMAIRNSEDAQNLIDTVEGAHVEINASLQRLRELAVQSSNDTNSGVDRSFLKAEATQLISEIDRIVDQTEWNGMKVLNGVFDSKQFQVGIDQTQDIVVDVADVSASSIGTHIVNGVGQGTAAAAAAAANGLDDSLTLNGFLGSKSINTDANASANAIATQINAEVENTGIDAKAVSHAVIASVSAAGIVGITIGEDGSTTSAQTVTATVTTTDLSNLRDAINAVSGATGVTAGSLAGSQSSLLLKDADGHDIVLSNYTNTGAATATVTVQGYNFLGTAAATGEDATTLTETTTDSVTVAGNLKLTSPEVFEVTATAAKMFGGSGSSATSFNSSLSNVGAINIGTVTGAEQAIDVIDGAINKINEQRSYLGAISNRLDKTINNLTNIVENTSESRSHINDADFAAETTKLTKAQILNQAATSMLAQANASKQSLLALLQQ